MKIKNFLSIMSRKTKLKCVGIILLAFVSSLLASIWPVRLAELYTNISNGTINTLAKGALAVATFGLIYLSAECITILRRVMLDCVIATHESEVRENSVEKLLKMPASFYSGSLSGEKTAQLNQGVSGFSQLIKIMCNDVFATVLTAVCTLVQVFLNVPWIMVGIMMLYLALTILISVFQIRSQNGIREKIVGYKNSLDGQICQSDWIAVAYAAAICAGSSLFMWSATAGFILSSKVNAAGIEEEGGEKASWGVGQYLKYGFINYAIQLSIALAVMAVVL